MARAQKIVVVTILGMANNGGVIYSLEADPYVTYKRECFRKAGIDPYETEELCAIF